MLHAARTVLGVFLMTLALAGTATASQFEDGQAAYARRDYATAMQLWRPLADQGNPDAQINLGNMYFDGNGVPQDYGEAVKWYRFAADHGSADAQIALGFLYEYGDAVPQDYIQAHKWFDLAGSPSYRDAVAAKMTPAQIAEAQKLERDWEAAHPGK
jgi:TPR repeat protein